MRRIAILLITVVSISCNNPSSNKVELYEGDILFQDLDCGEACDAIEKVTEGVDGWDFSHCGIIAKVDGVLQVVEAYGQVQAVPIDVFMNRSVDGEGKPKVLLGRLDDVRLGVRGAALATSYIGKDYDEEFKLSDDKYYCSELVYECFKLANEGKEVFPLNDMTFKDPQTNEFMPFWIKYYSDLGVDIPEGEKGINPGAISRNEHLDIIELH